MCIHKCADANLPRDQVHLEPTTADLFSVLRRCSASQCSSKRRTGPETCLRENRNRTEGSYTVTSTLSGDLAQRPVPRVTCRGSVVHGAPPTELVLCEKLRDGKACAKHCTTGYSRQWLSHSTGKERHLVEDSSRIKTLYAQALLAKKELENRRG